MKKIFGIIFIFILIGGNSFAGVEEVIKEIKKNKDIAQGFNKVVDRGEDNKRNNWRVTNKKILDSDKDSRKHVVKIVDKSENHPVRFGKQSLRFEVRDGDGWGWDSRNNRERVELLICCVNKKTTWSAWSLYLPKDYKIIFPAKTMLAQFHNDGDYPPAFAFENQSNKIQKEGGGYWIEIDGYVGGNNVPIKLLDKNKDLKDILSNENTIICSPDVSLKSTSDVIYLKAPSNKNKEGHNVSQSTVDLLNLDERYYVVSQSGLIMMIDLNKNLNYKSNTSSLDSQYTDKKQISLDSFNTKNFKPSLPKLPKPRVSFNWPFRAKKQ